MKTILVAHLDSQLELTILGSGSSWGVPVIGCKCKVCLSDSLYNKRTRSSIIISSNTTNVLVDFGFEIRSQLLREGIDKIDAVILTHDHADHVSGLDDLRIFKLLHGYTPKFYADHVTLDKVTKRYKYLFDADMLKPIGIDFNTKLTIGDIDLQCFRQDHGVMDSLGIRVGDTVYSNDVLIYPEESKQYLRNARTWVIDCIDENSTETHAGLDLVMQWRDEFKPEQVYLTNMSHMVDYFDIQSKLPKGVMPSYDGLKLKVG